MTDLHALIRRMADELDAFNHPFPHPLATEARAVLAKSEPERPTVMQIIELADQIEAAELGQVDLVRAALARWSRPAPQPADGEVAELVEGLRLISDGMSAMGHDSDSWFVARAAELLERLSPPQPIPVSERLPEPGDCDAKGRCWWWYSEVPGKTYGYWAHEDDAMERASDEQPSAWLPAHALPLPSGEVE